MAKKWWLENYKSILMGALIAVVVVGGWRYWQYRTTSRSQAAAALFEQLAGSMAAKDQAGALKTGNELKDHYSDTPYAAHAALALAQLQTSTGKPEDGEQSLDWVIK